MDAEGDTEVARQTTKGGELWYGAGDYSLDFGGIIIYPARAAERAMSFPLPWLMTALIASD